ncbi:MAG: hypothetical protein HN855_07575 [Anaerolineae bacterium]|nr:hypothetical protein [Anaerolineae bacterium]MBT7071965.1 hypothetical protein [Anaerolineae bacterium]MBT7324999.1 hypothetical protein [Anaerolineae bacterium]
MKEFSLWLQSNLMLGKHKRRSKKTIQSYVDDVDCFADWIKQTTDTPLLN